MFAIFLQISSCVKKGNMEELAILVRHFYLGERARKPALELQELMKGSGFLVKNFPLGYFGALIVEDKSGNIQPSMLIDDRVRDFQGSFLTAYMLGHFLLEVQPKIVAGNFTSSAFYAEVDPLAAFLSRSGKETKDQAALAQDFAAALFTPEKMLRRALSKFNFEKTAEIFGVSAEFLQARKRNLLGEAKEPVAIRTKTRDPLAGLRGLAKKIDGSVKS